MGVEPPVRAVFLDRDGTINIDHGYVGQVDRFEIIPRALEGLEMLGKAGFLLFVVTNQSGLERGLFTEGQMQEVHDHLQELLRARGVGIRQFCVSPYREATPNDVRKPSPKLILQAAREHGVDLSSSYMVGDKGETDILCGRNAGCRTVLVRTGTGRQWENHPAIRPDHVADDLLDAAQWIVSQV